jgi:hypothetical protein
MEKIFHSQIENENENEDEDEENKKKLCVRVEGEINSTHELMMMNMMCEEMKCCHLVLHTNWRTIAKEMCVWN